METKPGYLSFRRAGFTLAELLLALSVMSIVLTAAATFAFAMSSAMITTNNMGEKQARLRFSIMRIRELARNSSHVFTLSNGVAFWVDDANGDGQVNINELAWLQTRIVVDVGISIRITEFPDEIGTVAKIEIIDGSALSLLRNKTGKVEMILFDECVSASITTYSTDKAVVVDFSLIENNEIKGYQISGVIRGSAEYLFDSSENMVLGDDDL